MSLKFILLEWQNSEKTIKLKGGTKHTHEVMGQEFHSKEVPKPL